MTNIKIQDIPTISRSRTTRDFVYVRVPKKVLQGLEDLGLTGPAQDKIFKLFLNVLRPDDILGTYQKWKQEIQIKKGSSVPEAPIPGEDEEQQE